jgi:hypothetical protein
MGSSLYSETVILTPSTLLHILEHYNSDGNCFFVLLWQLYLSTGNCHFTFFFIDVNFLWMWLVDKLLLCCHNSLSIEMVQGCEVFLAIQEAPLTSPSEISMLTVISFPDHTAVLYTLCSRSAWPVETGALYNYLFHLRNSISNNQIDYLNMKCCLLLQFIYNLSLYSTTGIYNSRMQWIIWIFVINK